MLLVGYSVAVANFLFGLTQILSLNATKCTVSSVNRDYNSGNKV